MVSEDIHKKMKKLNLVLMLFILIGLAYAIEESTYTSYKVDENVTLKISVGNHSDVCTDCICTLDIVYCN